MTSRKKAQEIALGYVPKLLDTLLEQAQKGNVQASRLLLEIAGMATKSTTGRPRKFASQEEEELSPEEMEERSEHFDRILEDHAKRNSE